MPTLHRRYGMSFVFNSLPVDAPLRVTSKFGDRSTGIIGASKNHAGVDIARSTSKAKTNILAVKSGTVSASFYNSIRGWVVMIKHDATHETLYQHLASKSPLAVGAKVKAGDVIGVMGSTGVSSGTHLHFELHKGGTPINPEPYLNNIQEDIDMTRDEVRALVKETVKETINEILIGAGTEESPWFGKEFKGKEKEIGEITDRSRPQGYAKREEVWAMIARTIGI